MNLTIEQALQKGITAHKEGRLQDAERCYRAILQSQPAHPDANHNLGVLAVSINKADKALPLFKVALEANPKIEQFWLSYIDALIKAKQLYKAQKTLEQAKVQGMAGVKFDTLASKCQSQTPCSETAIRVPPQELIDSLLGDYQNGRYENAHSLAVSITQKYPDHQIGWQVLAAILKRVGKIGESLIASQKAVQIDSQDSDAHYNLGNTLKELGRLEESTGSYSRAIALKPDFSEAHVNLGASLKDLGRLNEAEASYNRAIALKPGYALAHSNLGTTLKELGRFDEAEASYNRAIALEPENARAHYGLGVTFHELGRLDEAESCYKQAIALKSDYVEAHNNLGSTLKELGKLDESAVSYTRALALKPDLGEAHNNLGTVLQKRGRLEEAEASYNRALAADPNNVETLHNLSVVQNYLNNFEAEVLSLETIIQGDAQDYGFKANVNLAICYFLVGNFPDSNKHLLAATKIQGRTSSEPKNERAYCRYLSKILKWHEHQDFNKDGVKNDNVLYVLGESHSLSSHYLNIKYSGIVFLCIAKLIKGCKQWHLGEARTNQYKRQFEDIFDSLPKHSYVLLAIGEIDCRFGTGIIAHKKKYPEKQIKEIIRTTVGRYLDYIVHHNSYCQHNVIIQGVPCPNIDTKNYSGSEVAELVEVIRLFNYELKIQSKKRTLGFLDTHKLTNNGEGFSTGLWHTDDYHLSPRGMQEAWRTCASA